MIPPSTPIVCLLCFRMLLFTIRFKTHDENITVSKWYGVGRDGDNVSHLDTCLSMITLIQVSQSQCLWLDSNPSLLEGQCIIHNFGIPFFPNATSFRIVFHQVAINKRKIVIDEGFRSINF